MAVAATFVDSDDRHDEDQYFDLSADRAVARALPALLTPALELTLAEASVTVADVATVGLALAGKAPSSRISPGRSSLEKSSSGLVPAVGIEVRDGRAATTVVTDTNAARSRR